MRTIVNLETNYPLMNLRELEELVSEVRILSKVRIKHDKRIMKTAGKSRIDRRTIYLTSDGDPNIPRIYLVQDYVLRSDGSGVDLVGFDTYNSSDLRKR
jgi:hypothetical protein